MIAVRKSASRGGRASSSKRPRRFPHKTRSLVCWIALAQLLFVLTAWQHGHAWTGRVVELEDGDSGKALSGLTTIEFRLYGIDAPESDQPYGAQAKLVAARLLLWRQIEFKTLDRDQYGREVGLAYVNGRCVNEELIRSGCAWVYPTYCKESFCADWAALGEYARSKKAGLWRGKDPVPPWQFRRQAGRPEVNGAPALQAQTVVAGEYHGNTLSKVFHRPTCEHYNCKNCTARFYTKDQAIQAGFKPCAVCKP